MEKEKVWRIHYTADNRVKLIRETEEPKRDSNEHWWIVAGGVIVAIVWVIIWV